MSGPGPGSDAPRDEAPEPERVRACTRCNEIVLFDVRTCPACGHVDPLVVYSTLGDARRECRACGQEMRTELMFCAHCGAEQSPAALPVVEPQRAVDTDVRLLHLVAVLLALLGPLTLLLAVISAGWS